MTVMLTQISGQDYSIRNDAIRRRTAEAAYNRHEKYNGAIQKTLKKLILDKTEVTDADSKQSGFVKLGAGQMKQVSLPIGKTLEETIDLWRGVRTEAISTPEPTTADYQLAATASSKIRQAEAQLGLHHQAKSAIENAAMEENAVMSSMESMKLPSSIDRELLELETRYKQAISSYSFHVQMKNRGFEIDTPSFYKIA